MSAAAAKPSQTMHGLVNELRSIVSSVPGKLHEKESEHWPYKRQSTLKGGPNKDFQVRTVKQADDWECSCSNYKCTCKGIGADNEGHTKKVRINKKYKKRYNKAFKAWKAGQKKKKK